MNSEVLYGLSKVKDSSQKRGYFQDVMDGSDNFPEEFMMYKPSEEDQEGKDDDKVDELIEGDDSKDKQVHVSTIITDQDENFLSSLR